MNEPLKLIAHLEPYSEKVKIYARQGDRFASNIEFVKCEPGDLIPPTPLELCRDKAQALMDSLWDCGIRPTEGNGSAGAMRATEKHLEDMRKIAFMMLDASK